MNEFGAKKNILSRLNGIHFSILFFLVLIIFFVHMVSNISSDTVSRQEESLSQALSRCIVSCYCVEGTYPPNVAYLINHYGLLYDDDTFFIDYRFEGSNIYPDVSVLRRAGK